MQNSPLLLLLALLTTGPQGVSADASLSVFGHKVVLSFFACKNPEAALPE